MNFKSGILVLLSLIAADVALATDFILARPSSYTFVRRDEVPAISNATEPRPQTLYTEDKYASAGYLECYGDNPSLKVRFQGKLQTYIISPGPQGPEKTCENLLAHVYDLGFINRRAGKIQKIVFEVKSQRLPDRPEEDVVSTIRVYPY
jgi:hypothetical protein